jgi:ribosomal protein S18 acetylase RimI-like enzyme
MSEFVIRTLCPADWAIYKTIRLASLADSPDSFSSTYEREILFPDSEWQSRLERNERAQNALALVAEYDGVSVGLSWGLIHEPYPNMAHVYQMWVSPEARGRGIAKSFLDRITSWAEARGCESVALSVATVNDAAVSLYCSAGFVPSGEVEELREGSTLLTQPMVRVLGNAA